jgi:hypothetical protein
MYTLCLLIPIWPSALPHHAPVSLPLPPWPAPWRGKSWYFCRRHPPSPSRNRCCAGKRGGESEREGGREREREVEEEEEVVDDVRMWLTDAIRRHLLTHSQCSSPSHHLSHTRPPHTHRGPDIYLSHTHPPHTMQKLPLAGAIMVAAAAAAHPAAYVTLRGHGPPAAQRGGVTAVGVRGRRRRRCGAAGALQSLARSQQQNGHYLN